MWVEVANWKDRWEIVKEIEGGGQGEALQARRIDDHHPDFLKVIKSKGNPERRARFSREANAYDTFRIDGIPRPIESNAHRHGEARETAWWECLAYFSHETSQYPRSELLAV